MNATPNEDALRKMIGENDLPTLRKIWVALAKEMVVRGEAPGMKPLRGFYASYGEDPRATTYRIFEHTRNSTYEQVSTGKKAWSLDGLGRRAYLPVYETRTEKSEAVFGRVLAALQVAA